MKVILLNDRNDAKEKICHQENIKNTVGRAKVTVYLEMKSKQTLDSTF